jgi:hypothetical protein
LGEGFVNHGGGWESGLWIAIVKERIEGGIVLIAEKLGDPSPGKVREPSVLVPLYCNIGKTQALSVLPTSKPNIGIVMIRTTVLKLDLRRCGLYSVETKGERAAQSVVQADDPLYRPKSQPVQRGGTHTVLVCLT